MLLFMCFSRATTMPLLCVWLSKSTDNRTDKMASSVTHIISR
nr:MAG TPA: hypothetical protein [Caudoviricetes sp.]